MLLIHYARISWRHLISHKLFSGINILGLAVGLVATILILLFVKDELSYDKFWSQADRIYRIHTEFFIPGREPILSVQSPAPLIRILEKAFPQIEKSARVWPQEPVVRQGVDNFIEQVAFVDPFFIEIFDLKVIAGNLKVAMEDSSSIVLNRTLAKKYFSTENPVGRVLTMTLHGQTGDYKVAAIIEDIPSNSQINVAAFAVIDESRWQDVGIFDNWFAARTQLYFTLKQLNSKSSALQGESGIIDIRQRLKDVVDRDFPMAPIGGPESKTSDFIKLSAMSVKDLHLKSVGFGAMRERGSLDRVIIFSVIAGLILLIATINFMNLSTARSSLRAKEVSIRKVLGAGRMQLVVQFLGESVLISLTALVIALSLVEIILPTYNHFLNKTLELNYLTADIFILLGIAVVVGIIGGIYPAFVLSAFRPALVLKANKSTEISASARLRAVLVVFQFSVSIGLFVCTTVVYDQMRYVQNADLGYTEENLLMLGNAGQEDAKGKQETIIGELRNHAQIISVTRSSETPDTRHRSNILVRTNGAIGSNQIVMKPIYVGYDFFETYGIPVVAGRTYDIERSDDPPSLEELRSGTTKTGKIVINQAAVKKIGYSSNEDAIGKLLFYKVSLPPDETEMVLEIIGVAHDTHFESLHSSIVPEIYPFHRDSDEFNSFSLRYTGDPNILLKDVKALWKKEVPTVPFSYRYVDELAASNYGAEAGQAKIFAVFALLAIVVACLGLYGLASFSAERRTREIGIRKVMGAGVVDVVKLLLWQFSKPVAIANFLAWPVAIYSMSVWLERFAYHVEKSDILIFCFIAGIAALLIAWSTVSTISYRIAREKPVRALRYE